MSRRSRAPQRLGLYPVGVAMRDGVRGTVMGDDRLFFAERGPALSV